MPTDFVQIGSFTVSKTVFDVFTIILSVITGGLVTYFTTQAVEKQKWKQQKKDRQQEQYREALAFALDWLAPIETALIHIESLSSAFIMCRITQSDFQTRWPNLLSELSRIDRAIPAKLKVLLPENTYDGMDIVYKINELYSFLLSTEPSEQRNDNTLLERMQNTVEQITAIKKSFENYKNSLIDEYKKTYQ